MNEEDTPITPPPEPSEERTIEQGLPPVDETPPTPPVKPPKDTDE